MPITGHEAIRISTGVHVFFVLIRVFCVQVIEVFGTQLTTEFLMHIMGPQSVVPRLYFSQDKQVTNYYHWILSSTIKSAGHKNKDAVLVMIFAQRLVFLAFIISL